MVRMSSSTLASTRKATVASATSSVDRGPIMWTPSTSSYFLSATIFTNQSPPTPVRLRSARAAAGARKPSLRCRNAERSTRTRRPDARIRPGHAPVFRTLDNLERVRVLEQGLGWDASPQQTSAPERLLFLDNRDRQPELRRANGSDVAASSGP